MVTQSARRKTTFSAIHRCIILNLMAKSGRQHENELLKPVKTSTSEDECMQTQSLISRGLDTKEEAEVMNDGPPNNAKSRGAVPHASVPYAELDKDNQGTKKKSPQDGPKAQSHAKESILSLLMGQGSGEAFVAKGRPLVNCRAADGYDSPKTLPSNAWTTQAAVKKILQSGDQNKEAPRQSTPGPSQLQALLQMPKEQLKKDSPLAFKRKFQPRTFGEASNKSQAQAKSQDSQKQRDVSQLYENSMSKNPQQLPEKPATQSQNESQDGLSAYLYQSYQIMLSSAQENALSDPVPSVPLKPGLICDNPSAQERLNIPFQKLKPNLHDNCPVEQSNVLKKQRLHSDNGVVQMIPWQSTSSSLSEPPVESRQRRFQRTRLALERSGLLDVTMKTAQLIHENKMLEQDINQLKNDADDLVQSVIHQQDPDVHGFVLAKCASFLMGNKKK